MKNLKLFFILFFAATLTNIGYAQEYVLPLYSGKIPNAIENGGKESIEKTDINLVREVHEPTISVYLPSKRFSTGQAVLICPGGGYWVLAYDLEGTDIARYFNSIGVAAIVLKYRLPTWGNVSEPHKVPLMDAQRAMRMVRKNAEKWNIKTDKIGVMGFSAGGHLASTLGTHFDYGNRLSPDSIERVSCRPNFMVLMYPVITFTDSFATHNGSLDALLGKNPDKKLIRSFSNEFQVHDDTPPAFLVHADDDDGVLPENTILFYKALREKCISAEVHIISEGNHGFGLAINNAHIASWSNSLKLWLNWLNDTALR